MLIDTTLREGAQLFGAYFDVDTRAHIVSGLLALGVNELELGWVGQEDLNELVDRVRPGAGGTALSVWSPCREADIKKAAGLDIDRISIGVPVSDAHIETRLSTDRDGLLELAGRAVLTATLLGIKYISVGLEDFSRADKSFALKVARMASDMGAARIRLSDSVGVLSPPETQRLVTIFRNHLDIDIAVHCHDDFGMATANAVTALAAGADYADCSVLGIGERSGIAATEELAAYLTLKEGNHDYKTDRLKSLCTFVSRVAGVSVPRTKAVAGKDIFACESGLHAHALSKSPDLFEPYAPAAIGADRTVAVGGKSGRAAVVGALNEHGLDCPENRIADLTNAVRTLSMELGRPLTPDEFARLTSETGGCM